MRRPVGLVLVTMGAFFLTLPPLTYFYVANRIIVAPRNIYQVTRLEARDAAYFDTAALKTRRGATLVARNEIRGNVQAVGDGDVAVWDSSTVMYDRDRGKPLEVQDHRVAFNRRTCVLVDCCGAHVAGDTGVRFAGYGLMFPVADVRRRDYPFFDVTTRRIRPMRFDGTDRVRGLRTYRFVQQIPPTRVGRVDSIPGVLLGLGNRSGNVEADRYFAMRVTVWVDPRTGVPVKQVQAMRIVVRTPGGRGRLTAVHADLVTVQADQDRLVRRSARAALVIRAVRTYIPAGSLAAGLVMLPVGAALRRGARRSGRRAPAVESAVA